MIFSFNDLNVNFQFIPLHGLAIGGLYYDPNLEPDREEDVEKEEFYSQITLMFLFFGLHITIWRE